MRLQSYVPAIILSSLAFQAAAAPVSINILAPARDNNFHYSYTLYTHSTEYTGPSAVYYYGGRPTSALKGRLVGDLTGGLLRISGGELLRLAKPDGSVLLNANPYARILGRMTLRGTLVFTNQGLSNRDFSRAVNKRNNLGDSRGRRLWGNNWDPTTRIHYVPGAKGHGIDLGGEIATQPIPEPTSVLLFGAGAAIVGGAVVRKRKQEQG